MSNAVATPAPHISELTKVHQSLCAVQREEAGITDTALRARTAAIAVLDKAATDFSGIVDRVGRNAIFAEGARFLDILFLPLQNSVRVQAVDIVREGEDLIVVFENGWRFVLDTNDDQTGAATEENEAPLAPMGQSSLKAWSFKTYSENLRASGCQHWLLPEAAPAALALDTAMTNLCALSTGIEYGLQAEVTNWIVACDELQRNREDALQLEAELDRMLEQLALRVPATASPADFEHLPVEKAAGVMALFSGLTGSEIMAKLVTHPGFADALGTAQVADPAAV